MGRLIELLKQEKPSGKSAWLRQYVSTNFADILTARQLGYSHRQIAETISKLTDRLVGAKTLTGAVYHIAGRQSDNGYLVKYSLNKAENTLWREFNDEKAITQYIENLAAKKSTAGAYTVTGKVISIKKMSRFEYEKSVKNQRKLD